MLLAVCVHVHIHVHCLHLYPLSLSLLPSLRYIGMRTRIDAEVALHRSRDGVFLIRESMDRPGEYAVALKYIQI